MHWLTVYLASIIVFAIVIGACQTSNNDTIRMGKGDFWLSSAFIIVWPFTILVLAPICILMETYKESVRDKASSIISENDISSSKTDRTGIVAMNERDLKFLMKISRKGIVELSPNQIENIREELKNRMVERTILK